MARHNGNGVRFLCATAGPKGRIRYIQAERIREKIARGSIGVRWGSGTNEKSCSEDFTPPPTHEHTEPTKTSTWGMANRNQIVSTETRERALLSSQVLTATTLLLAAEISDGLSTTVFPAARAPMTGLSSRLNGKFQGAMTDTTPYGSFQT